MVRFALTIYPYSLPVKKSNGQIVYEQLEKVVEKTGVPRQIISDHGTDIQAHKQTCFTYDIKHKGAGVLKRELENDQS